MLILKNPRKVLQLMALICICSIANIGVAKDIPVTQYTIKQRSTIKIDILPKDSYLHIGDITAGQVLVNLKHNKKYLVPTTSMQQGDIVKFSIEGADAYLLLQEYNNFLLGGDYCVFQIYSEISLKQPEAPKPTLKKENDSV
jgi:hypothetical protein